MTTLEWDKVGERDFETGVSKGVFYGTDGKGVVWNGLTSVEESNTKDVEPLYFDGVKYAELVTNGDFQGKMKAFTYPDAFLPYIGVDPWQPGFYLADQPMKRFGLSYRTEIQNDMGEAAYKLHVLYNVLAIPANTTHDTMGLDPEPVEFEWDISAIPEDVDRYRPTAHLVMDSRKIDPYLLLDIEALLYGTDTDDAMLPPMKALITYVQKWGRLVITDNGDGTWTAHSPIPGVIEMVSGTEFEIVTDTATYLDANTYEISSSAEEEL